MPGVVAWAGDYPTPVYRTKESMRHYVRFTARISRHLCVIFEHQARITVCSDNIIFTNTSHKIYFNANDIAAKAALAPLVVKQFPLPQLEQLYHNQGSMLANASYGIYESNAAF